MCDCLPQNFSEEMLQKHTGYCFCFTLFVFFSFVSCNFLCSEFYSYFVISISYWIVISYWILFCFMFLCLILFCLISQYVQNPYSYFAISISHWIQISSWILFFLYAFCFLFFCLFLYLMFRIVVILSIHKRNQHALWVKSTLARMQVSQ